MRKSPAQRTANQEGSAAAPLQAQSAPTGSGLTLRQAAVAIACGLVCVVLVAIAIRYTEMVSGQYISNGVPPLPAFAALLVMSVSRPFLQRFAPRLAPNRAQILLIYSMLTVSVILSGLYHVRAFLPHLIAMHTRARCVHRRFVRLTLIRLSISTLFCSLCSAFLIPNAIDDS